MCKYLCFSGCQKVSERRQKDQNLILEMMDYNYLKERRSVCNYPEVQQRTKKYLKVLKIPQSNYKYLKAEYSNAKFSGAQY